MKAREVTETGVTAFPDDTGFVFLKENGGVWRYFYITIVKD